MTEESRKNQRAQEWAPADSRSSEPGKPGQEGPELDRLPPPAFPPGSRRSELRPLTPSRLERQERNRADADESDPPGDVPERGSDDPFASALISPDDPIRHRTPRQRGVAEQAPEDDYGVATGIRDDGPVYGSTLEQVSARGPLHAAADSLEALAASLREQGRSALRVDAAMAHFDVMLRGFIAGYLAGQGEDPDPDA